MAVTSVSTLIERTRRMVRDWPDIDVTTASLSSNATLISVADGTLYPKNFHVEIESEVLTVATAGSGTTFAARRGAWGTTAATHATASEVKIRPNYPAIQILDALNQAKDEMFPLIYKTISDTNLVALANTYEYTIPALFVTGPPIPYISKVELRLSGATEFVEVRNYLIRRVGSVPVIQFSSLPDVGVTIRLAGYGPFADLTASGSTDSTWPIHAVNALVVGAASFLLASGEAGRVSVDTLANDAREQANRVGGALSISAALYSRFRSMTLTAAMPPLPRHCKPTF